ncbi:tigger transposable element-derived protein 6-like protein [Plakobranchus ocellatus]|uniref:Tigger transposable element-derived protein 6-like protein n=1 Tax=Plakobranchus ocellatus TaxID=259542 RepID=A0AAV3ZTA8_9GAST|nr:tigger transposable element-derived protein 6-like protein [Plakobranchus ocellatus]
MATSNDLLIKQRSVIEFLAAEGYSAADIMLIVIQPVFGAIPLRIVISGFAAPDESTPVSAMVRNYKRKTDWTEKSAENLQHLRETVKAVKNGQTIRQAAHNYGINKLSLCIRTPEPTSIARATAFNKTNVGPFFDKLKQLYEELSVTPERIYNVDETALSTSQKPQKVVAESRVKQVAQLVSRERGETITMLGIINAIGNSLPPCFVFPRKQFKPHIIFGVPPGTHGFANPSGSMTKQLFVECLRHIHRHVRSTPENKVLVFWTITSPIFQLKLSTTAGTMASSC